MNEAQASRQCCDGTGWLRLFGGRASTPRKVDVQRSTGSGAVPLDTVQRLASAHLHADPCKKGFTPVQFCTGSAVVQYWLLGSTSVFPFLLGKYFMAQPHC